MSETNADAGQDGPAIGAVRRAIRPQFSPQTEQQIQQLYLRMMAEPVPARILSVLRTGGCGAKA